MSATDPAPVAAPAPANTVTDYKWERIEPLTSSQMNNVFELYRKRPLVGTMNSKAKLLENYPCGIYLTNGAHAGANSAEESGKKIVGGILWWQTPFGNKISTSFASSHELYLTQIIPKYIELLSTEGYYAEISDALEYIIRSRYGLENITDAELITKVLPMVKPEDIFTEKDPRRNTYPLHSIKKIQAPIGSYIREIVGIGRHRKSLYGKPCLTGKFTDETCFKTCTQGGGRRQTRSKKLSGTRRANRQKNI